MTLSPQISRLSMVSGNGVSSLHRPSCRSYRKMADIGVQYEPQDSEVEIELPIVNSTVAEINTNTDTAEVESTSPSSVTCPPISHSPLSVESTSSSSSSIGEEREQKKTLTDEDLDVDAIYVQQSMAEEDFIADLNNTHATEGTEPDGVILQNKEESNCGLDCVYFTMQCCECTIL